VFVSNDFDVMTLPCGSTTQEARPQAFQTRQAARRRR
jgi:hypothetical protein